MKLYVLIVNQCGILDHLAVGTDLNSMLATLQQYPVSKEQCRRFVRMQQLLTNNPGAAFTEYGEYLEDFSMSDTDIYLREVHIDEVKNSY